MIERLVSFWDCQFFKAYVKFPGKYHFFGEGLPFSRCSSGNNLHADLVKLLSRPKKNTSFGTPKGGGLVREMGRFLFQGNRVVCFFTQASEEQENLGW